ncbi:MAG: hypothetical protein QM769_14895 [Pseudoxanthomonas sp.]
MTDKQDGIARLAALDSDYQALGLDRDTIAPWEDGQRIGTGPGAWEWWYFDSHLDNGATLVVGFYTKPPDHPEAPLMPVLTLNLTLPDGRIFDKKRVIAPAEFSASKEGCDVRMAENVFKGDLHRYRIEASIDDIAIKLDLQGEIPSWRPRTGHRFFEKDGQRRFFAWFPSVPQGRVDVSCRIGDEHFETTGTGYHDHNWGDAAMAELIHDWYWARASIGPYTVIASHIVGEQDYGYQSMKAFVLATDGRIVADDETRVRFEAEQVFTDESTGKPVANVTRYTFDDGKTKYVIAFVREKTILNEIFGADVDGERACYQRFIGKATLEKFEDGQLIERHEDSAIWEMMYFGQALLPSA